MGEGERGDTCPPCKHAPSLNSPAQMLQFSHPAPTQHATRTRTHACTHAHTLAHTGRDRGATMLDHTQPPPRAPLTRAHIHTVRLQRNICPTSVAASLHVHCETQDGGLSGWRSGQPHRWMGSMGEVHSWKVAAEHKSSPTSTATPNLKAPQRHHQTHHLPPCPPPRPYPESQPHLPQPPAL